MYAHQVIEDLLKSKKVHDDVKKALIKNIKSSVKFSFSSMGEIQQPFINILGKKQRAFLDDSDSLIFPFPICWFDYGHSKIDDIRFGSLVNYNHEKREFELFHFIKEKQIGGWHPVPLMLSIRIGRYWDDNPSIGNIIPVLIWQPEGHFNPKEDMIQYGGYEVSFLVFALKLLSCKNISTEKNYPQESLNKKRIKQGKQPLFTYHTLVVNPMSEKKLSDGPHEATGIKQRLHFCRGHFKEYTDGNKLFGKHTGLYWWQPMVRGNKEIGLVHKDYLVKCA